jgi:hypothetical protein
MPDTENADDFRSSLDELVTLGKRYSASCESNRRFLSAANVHYRQGVLAGLQAAKLRVIWEQQVQAILPSLKSHGIETSIEAPLRNCLARIEAEQRKIQRFEDGLGRRLEELLLSKVSQLRGLMHHAGSISQCSSVPAEAVVLVERYGLVQRDIIQTLDKAVQQRLQRTRPFHNTGLPRVGERTATETEHSYHPGAAAQYVCLLREKHVIPRLLLRVGRTCCALVRPLAKSLQSQISLTRAERQVIAALRRPVLLLQSPHDGKFYGYVRLGSLIDDSSLGKSSSVPSCRYRYTTIERGRFNPPFWSVRTLWSVLPTLADQVPSRDLQHQTLGVRNKP